MYRIDRDIVDRLVEGSIDFHVHVGPDPIRRRRLDALDLARQAKGAGMRAAVIKNHYYDTSSLAYAANKVVSGFSLMGSLVLNSAVGGLNPEATEVAVRLGAKVIWMPTYSSIVDVEKRRTEESNMSLTNRAATSKGINLMSKDGRLIPEVVSILQIARESNTVIGTGHISIPEIYAIVEAARDFDIKVTVTHPLNESYGSKLTLAQQLELVGKGAFMEHCFLDFVPSPRGEPDFTLLVDYIKSVGVENCVLCTDFGQYQNPTPLEGFRMMLIELLKAGLSETEIEIMVKTNPALLLGMD